jgi:hypothetical protein
MSFLILPDYERDSPEQDRSCQILLLAKLHANADEPPVGDEELTRKQNQADIVWALRARSSWTY